VLLYLVRHAIAVPHEALGAVNDAGRPLTRDGIKKMRRIARSLQRLGVQLAQIWTSPLTRARQTAELLAEPFALSTAIREEPALEPGGSFDNLISLLKEHQNLPAIALVGHEPYLGELATYLLSGVRSGSVSFKKGGVACIEMGDLEPPARGQLLWLLTPGQIRRLK